MLNANKGTILEKAVKLTSWLAENVPERDVPDTFKTRAAGTCFTIVRDHQAAIVHLIETGHPSPAFSLSRSVYEGYLRGQWLLHCATEAQADHYLDGKELEDAKGKRLSISDLINDLEQTSNFSKGTLSDIKKKAWGALCDFAHVGGRLVNHWNKGKSIEANFSPDEVDEVLRLTGMFAALAALGMIELADVPSDEQHAEQILEQMKAFSWYPLPETAAP